MPHVRMVRVTNTTKEDASVVDIYKLQNSNARTKAHVLRKSLWCVLEKRVSARYYSDGPATDSGSCAALARFACPGIVLTLRTRLFCLSAWCMKTCSHRFILLKCRARHPSWVKKKFLANMSDVGNEALRHFG